MLSRSIITAVKNSQTNRNHQDLTLVCEGGLLVQTNTALLATISKRMGELFNSLVTFPEVVIMPNIKKVVLEELLEMYSLKWRERELSSELIEAAELLGFPILQRQPLFALQTNQHTMTKKQTKNQPVTSSHKIVKQTMPSVLLKVKQEAQNREKNENLEDGEDETDGEDIFDGVEEEEGLERSETNNDLQTKAQPDNVTDNMEEPMCQIEDLLGNGKFGEEEIVQNSFKCCECETLFIEKDDLSIHIGGVHMEEELLTLLSMVFPGDFSACSVCEEKDLSSEYEKKEHILLKHPWPPLRALLEEGESTLENEETGNNENDQGCESDDMNEAEKFVAAVDSNIDRIAESSNPENHLECSEENAFKCDECGLTFETNDCAKMHIGEVHMEDELMIEVTKLFPDTNFKCSQCEEESDSEYEKKEHVLLHHPWPQLLAVVNQDEEAHLKESEKCETDMPETVAVGDKSSKVSSQTLKWHTGIIYSCNYCKFEFTRNIGKRHLETVHNMTFLKGEFSKHITFEPKKYSCKVCRLKVGHSLSNIRQHVKMHNLTLDQYETKYEIAPNENPANASTGDEDTITKLLDESVNIKIVQISTLLAEDNRDQKPRPLLARRKRKAAQNDETPQPKHSKSTSRNIDEMQLFLEMVRSKSDKNIAELQNIPSENNGFIGKL